MYEDALHPSIESCLKENFNCSIIKHECIVAIEEIDWKGFTIDVVGYNEKEHSLFIVEAKNVTWLGSNGFAEAIGQIMVYIAGLQEKEIMGSIRHYANLKNAKIEKVYFYIALPNFKNETLAKKIHPPLIRLFNTIRTITSNNIGLLEIYNIEKPANVMLKSEPIPYNFSI